MSPAVATTRDELAKLLAPARTAEEVVTFVPTMGALHEGHASLMSTARGHGDQTVVSIFVNPMQFGAGEDLDRYPRTFDADLAICEREGVDVVFAPSVEEVYPLGFETVASATSSTSGGVTVDPGPLADVLEGKTRPGHFRGVLTVVAKLFGLVQPDVAVFGQKDYQQLALIRQMVSDLCMDIEIVGAETIREADGLAMSSRNRFLTPDDRKAAAALSRALRAAQERAEYGVAAARWAAMSELKAEPGIELDYLKLTTPDLGELADDAQGEARILVAARVGTTRLIDNMPIELGNVVSTTLASARCSTTQERGDS
jgi:pantoate--beta-alanine ligase